MHYLLQVACQNLARLFGISMTVFHLMHLTLSLYGISTFIISINNAEHAYYFCAINICPEFFWGLICV